MRLEADDVIEIGILLFATVFLIDGAIDVKKLDATKEEFNGVIAEDMNYNSVNVKSFDWYTNDDNEYLFKFTGSAINSYDEEIDFFACSYEVSENQYNEILDYISDLKQGKIKSLKYTGLVEKLTDIVKDSELYQRKENPLVATEEGQNVILNVSKAKVDGDRVYYNVEYATPYRFENGKLGLRTTITEVSYSMNEDLAKHPTGVFLLPKENATIKVLKNEEKSIEIFNPVEFHKSSANRKKI